MVGRRPQDWSLRARILVITAVVSAVVGTTILVGYLTALNRILYDTATTSARDQANQVATLVLDQDHTPARALDEIPTQGALLQLLTSDGHVVAYSDRGVAGTALTHLRPAAGQTSTEQVDGIPSDPNDPYVLVIKGLDRAASDGSSILVVAVPLQTETAVVEGATGLLAGVGILLLGALLWLINRVITSALGRVEQIRAGVASIRATDRTTRVPVPTGDDEITRLATTMNTLLDRLERADQAQRGFVSNASHELRSPLTTIRMITETSPGGVDPNSTQVIASETLRMQHLVEDLLTLAKADDDGLGLRMVDVDIDDLVITAARRVRASTRLTVHTQVHATRISGDPLRLEQVMNNLVDNATRHASTSIALTCLTANDQAIIHVDNDGELVPEDQRLAIFDRFTRLQQSRDRDSGGSGLGLAIVQAIVAAHSGTVSVGESPQGWCRFTVRLPAPPLANTSHPGLDDQGETEPDTVTGSSL
ncbi:sensor histidine kinase [Arsenicicoccus bolidensis]|uniref:histidine kinase n=1 Tax=Arsenicicoccus bolidensis TaxID=229480 RepID=A0ABS9Q8G0_9MICO|nr:HAMP domain-containing sensor histidine kinase [Arsenicicoccus bolidensis]MCG7323555.1 HAMP domain-containing histidine kinase [Arsenicicoccus bolidensis]